MSYDEWIFLMDGIETERYSMDNHILHYVTSGTKDYEVDEDLETGKISAKDI